MNYMKNDAYIENLFLRVAFNDDQQAFKELFFEFYPALCVYAEGFTDCNETGKDLVQDTFLKIWKDRKRIVITSSFRNFLVTSVKNACLDYLRKQSLHQSYAEKQNRSSHLPDSPEEIYTLKELEDLINRALDKLPDNIRQAFEMSRFKDMTYDQIAGKMQISSKTVESYISKALVLLRIELKDYFPLLLLFCHFLRDLR